MKRCDVVLWALALLLGSACQQTAETPAQVVRAFHSALAQRDLNQAVQYLAPEIRQAFARVGDKLAQAMEMETEDPEAFFLAGAKAEVANPILGIETVEEDGQQAKVRVTAGDCRADKPLACRKETVKLKKHEGRWVIQVKLPPGLQAAGEHAKDAQKKQEGER